MTDEQVRPNLAGAAREQHRDSPDGGTRPGPEPVDRAYFALLVWLAGFGLLLILLLWDLFAGLLRR